MSCFRKFLGLARENGWLELDPLAGKRKRLFRKEETCPTFLTLEELKRIMEKDFSTARLNTMKDFFLFCCLTGLSYIDVKTLCPAHLYKDNEGKLWIHKARVKITTHKESCTCNVPGNGQGWFFNGGMGNLFLTKNGAGSSDSRILRFKKSPVEYIYE